VQLQKLGLCDLVGAPKTHIAPNSKDRWLRRCCRVVVACHSRVTAAPLSHNRLQWRERINAAHSIHTLAAAARLVNREREREGGKWEKMTIILSKMIIKSSMYSEQVSAACLETINQSINCQLASDAVVTQLASWVESGRTMWSRSKISRDYVLLVAVSHVTTCWWWICDRFWYDLVTRQRPVHTGCVHNSYRRRTGHCGSPSYQPERTCSRHGAPLSRCVCLSVCLTCLLSLCIDWLQSLMSPTRLIRYAILGARSLTKKSSRAWIVVSCKIMDYTYSYGQELDITDVENFQRATIST